MKLEEWGEAVACWAGGLRSLLYQMHFNADATYKQMATAHYAALFTVANTFKHCKD